ncbi:MAG TPA: glycosyltransferase family 4 protein [Solirubrobacteraceae bacterium]|nr:glycosyltransferase family 4 protein [Solirubrobacteraceae bacterium]
MSRKPRLLVITPDFPPARGGIQVLVHRLVSELERFERSIVTLESPGAAEFDDASGLAVRRVKAIKQLRGGRNLLLNAVAYRQAQSFRPDVTLSAHIVTSPAAAAIRRTLGGRTVQYFHAKEIGAKPRLAAFAARQAHTSIAVSDYTSRLIQATGVRPLDIRLISPGVELPSNVAPESAERPTFLTIARLEDRYKGHDVIIRALPLLRAKVPDVQWVVIGDGPLRPGLEQLAQAHGVADAVRFLGSVSDDERNSWLRRTRALVMPSRLPSGHYAGEGFGIVYLEANVFGKPVVAGNVGGALDSVADGESGLLVDPTDPVAVADAIARLLLDDELAARLGRGGAQRAQAFTWPLISERVEAVLLEQLRASARWDSSAVPA